jgi:biopolymer transport protein ExbB/TolQ
MHTLLTASWTTWLMLVLDVAALTAAVVHAARAEDWSFSCAVSLIAATPAIGFLFTIVGLVHSFAAVAGVDPSMKATLLAKGISEAMNCTALGLVVVPLWVTPFVIGEVRRSRRRRSTAKPSASG